MNTVCFIIFCPPSPADREMTILQVLVMGSALAAEQIKNKSKMDWRLWGGGAADGGA